VLVVKAQAEKAEDFDMVFAVKVVVCVMDMCKYGKLGCTYNVWRKTPGAECKLGGLSTWCVLCFWIYSETTKCVHLGSG
jgi:hypothetical protein